MLAARTFNQGFATVEYSPPRWSTSISTCSPTPRTSTPTAFEREALERIGMPEAIVMRHRPPHFGHVFAGDGYSAGYYSYMWSEVLDADGFGAFEEAGDIFDPAAAERLHDFVYAAGNLRDPEEAYRNFRGRVPVPEALLRKRGLIEVPVQAEL